MDLKSIKKYPFIIALISAWKATAIFAVTILIISLIIGAFNPDYILMLTFGIWIIVKIGIPGFFVSISFNLTCYYAIQKWDLQRTTVFQVLSILATAILIIFWISGWTNSILILCAIIIFVFTNWYSLFKQLEK